MTSAPRSSSTSRLGRYWTTWRQISDPIDPPRFEVVAGEIARLRAAPSDDPLDVLVRGLAFGDNEEAVVNQIDRIDLYSPRRSVSIPMQEPDLVVELLPDHVDRAAVPLLVPKVRDGKVAVKNSYRKNRPAI